MIKKYRNILMWVGLVLMALFLSPVKEGGYENFIALIGVLMFLFGIFVFMFEMTSNRGSNNSEGA